MNRAACDLFAKSSVRPQHGQVTSLESTSRNDDAMVTAVEHRLRQSGRDGPKILLRKA
jgi:hypothetical protein